MKKSLLTVGLAMAWLLGGCASTPTEDTPLPSASDAGQARQIEPEARALYAQAEQAFDVRNFEQAQKLFSLVKTRYPKGRAQIFASYRLGIINYYRENYPVAAKEFEYFVTRMPVSDLNFDATYNWAACEHQMGKNDRAYQVLSRLKISEVQAQGPKRAETVYQLTARVASALNNAPAAIVAYGLQLQLPLEDSVRVAVETRVDEQLNHVTQPQRLQALLSEVSEPTVRRKIEDRLSRMAAVPLEPAVAPIPMPVPGGGIGTGEVRPPIEAVTLPSGGSSGSTSHVGVILPLTGKWASYGKRALDGILLAANTFGDSSEFKIFVRDSGSNPVAAQNAVDELSSRHEVMAVIGPLSFKESAAVAERAEALGIPNISLANKEGISEKSPYLFQTGLTPAVQIENLVRFAVQQKGLRRFAILAPDNAFGKDMAQSFWEHVNANGAVISSYQLYPANERDFQEQIRNMVGLQDLKHRRLEVTKLNDYIKEVKAKTGKEPKVQLSPIIDFDAIFIPDSPKAVSQAAASLNYFDVNGVPLLGTAEWNSDQFFRRGANLIQTAIFPAGFFLGSTQTTTRDFVRGYQQAYGQAPDLLAAQAYEAMEILAHAIRNSGSSDRNRLANQLGSIRDLATPLGRISFDGQRVGRRKLAVLSFEGGTSITEHQ